MFLDNYEFFGKSGTFWLVFSILLLLIIGALIWAFSPKAEDPIIEGSFEGFYNAKVKFFGDHPTNYTIVCSRPEKCFDGWMIVTGNFTYSGEFGETIYLDNRQLEGRLDITWRDAWCLESDICNDRTPVKLNFRGHIKPPFVLDPWDTAQNLLIVGLVIFLIYKNKKRFSRIEFDSAIAKKFFKASLDSDFLNIVGRIYTKEDKYSGDKVFWVGCDVVPEGEAYKVFHIRQVQRRGAIGDELWDVDGNLRRRFFQKDGIDYMRKWQTSQRQYSKEDMERVKQETLEQMKEEKPKRIKKKEDTEKPTYSMNRRDMQPDRTM